MSSGATCGKCSGIKPNSIPGSAERCSASARNPCSASARNGVRNQPGILFGFSPECCSACPGIPTLDMYALLAALAGPQRPSSGDIDFSILIPIPSITCTPHLPQPAPLRALLRVGESYDILQAQADATRRAEI